MRIAAVILAGGRGRRMGGAIKANIVVGGRPLLQRVTEALGQTPSPIIVAHGATPAADLGMSSAHLAVPDLAVPYGGPLVGLAAAVAHCSGLREPPDALVSVAVDTPLMPADFVERLAAALRSDYPAVIARYAGQDYPTNAIWRLAAIRDLPLALAAGSAPRSLRGLAAGLGATFLDWPLSPGGDPFVNVNTPADLATLEARLAGPAGA